MVPGGGNPAVNRRGGTNDGGALVAKRGLLCTFPEERFKRDLCTDGCEFGGGQSPMLSAFVLGCRDCDGSDLHSTKGGDVISCCGSGGAGLESNVVTMAL